MSAPAVLTAERIDAMLSVMAEVCFESMVEAGQRQKAAEDLEAFDRGGRALQRACRNLRQTIAMKQRHDREAARTADAARRAAESAREADRREHRRAVERRSAQVRRHFERVLWDEYETDEALELFDEVDARLADLADAPDFLATPPEILIRRLADDVGVGEPRAPAEAVPPRPAPGAIAPPAPRAAPAARPAAAPARATPPPQPPQAEAAQPEPLQPQPPPPQAPPPQPPPPEPPDPPPYVPPWEKLRPGQVMPGGGTGW
jgi:hypothetical protein